MHLISNRRAGIRAGTALAVAVLAAVPALAVSGQASAAPVGGGASGAQPDARVGVNDASAAVLAAMQRDLGLTAEQVKQRAAAQAKAVEVDRTLQGRLGQAFGGSSFDAASGKLVVAVTDARSAAQVTAAGAQARVVKHSKTYLEGIKAELDALAGKAKGTAAPRTISGKRQPALAGLAGWYVDPKTDSVVVTAVNGQPRAAALATLAKYGDAVRVEYIASAPTSTADFMDGGDAINFSTCSAGFNLRNPSTGQGYLLTAGHCVSAGSSTYGQGGVFFGTVLESFFPTYDDAIIRADNPGYWIQGPWVDTNPSNGGVIVITGFTDAPVGTAICKSGITTKLTCGNITAKNETVIFDGVNTVYGETRHSACVERGDSGGSNFAVASSYTAEGVTSGAALYPPNDRCGAAVGQPTISWYFPIANSLSYYGPKYGVTVW
jgi:streptogrisin C